MQGNISGNAIAETRVHSKCKQKHYSCVHNIAVYFFLKIPRISTYLLNFRSLNVYIPFKSNLSRVHAFSVQYIVLITL